MTTINVANDMFDDAERGLEWLEKLEALQSRSASDQAAYEVAEYVMKLRTAVTDLAGDRTAAELRQAVGAGDGGAGRGIASSRGSRLLEYADSPRLAEIRLLTPAQVTPISLGKERP